MSPKCANCGEHDATRRWSNIPVCVECGALADVVQRRNEQQLKMLLILANDLIRVKLAKGELRPGEADAETTGARLHKNLQDQVRELQARGSDGDSPPIQTRICDSSGSWGDRRPELRHLCAVPKTRPHGD